jgi:hypothetical protein
MPKKDKVITLRINEKSFGIIHNYSASHGLSVNAYLNSIIDSYAEWFIPGSSYESTTIPKRMLSSLFSLASRDGVEDLAKQWADEPRNMAVLSGIGYEFTLESAVDFIRKLSKYVIGSDARIIPDDNNNNNISIIIRHSLGENFSFFFSRNIMNLTGLLQSVRVHVNYNENTISIKFERD